MALSCSFNISLVSLCSVSLICGARSLVSDIEHLLLALQASVGHLQLRLVERLLCVETVPVAGPKHVSVEILLSLPSSAVPLLPVAAIATGPIV